MAFSSASPKLVQALRSYPAFKRASEQTVQAAQSQRARYDALVRAGVPFVLEEAELMRRITGAITEMRTIESQLDEGYLTSARRAETAGHAPPGSVNRVLNEQGVGLGPLAVVAIVAVIVGGVAVMAIYVPPAWEIGKATADAIRMRAQADIALMGRVLSIKEARGEPIDIREIITPAPAPSDQFGDQVLKAGGGVALLVGVGLLAYMFATRK